LLYFTEYLCMQSCPAVRPLMQLLRWHPYMEIWLQVEVLAVMFMSVFVVQFSLSSKLNKPIQKITNCRQWSPPSALAGRRKSCLHTFKLVSPFWHMGISCVVTWHLFILSLMSSQFYIPCSNSHIMTNFILSTWCTMHNILGHDCCNVYTGAFIHGIGADTFTHLTLFQASDLVS
jgi:hypothetical protein